MRRRFCGILAVTMRGKSQREGDRWRGAVTPELCDSRVTNLLGVRVLTDGDFAHRRFGLRVLLNSDGEDSIFKFGLDSVLVHISGKR